MEEEDTEEVEDDVDGDHDRQLLDDVPDTNFHEEEE